MSLLVNLTDHKGREKNEFRTVRARTHWAEAPREPLGLRLHRREQRAGTVRARSSLQRSAHPGPRGPGAPEAPAFSARGPGSPRRAPERVLQRQAPALTLGDRRGGGAARPPRGSRAFSRLSPATCLLGASGGRALRDDLGKRVCGGICRKDWRRWANFRGGWRAGWQLHPPAGVNPQPTWRLGVFVPSPRKT